MKRAIVIGVVLGFALGFGCSTIGPCTSAVVSAQRRGAVATGTISVAEAQSRIGLETVPLWKAAVATVADTTLYGAAAWGIYTLAEEAFGDGSTGGRDTYNISGNQGQVSIGGGSSSFASSTESQSVSSSTKQAE